MYKFRLATESEKNEKDSYGNVPEGGEWIYGSGVGEGTYALFLGKVITLFGKPADLNDDWENMYNCDIVAEDEQGKKLFIIIYHGSGGPSYCIPRESVSDDVRQIYLDMAKELVAYIESAQPADYVHESVYYDIPANLTYIVKDGKATVKSVLPEEFDPEDFM